MLVKNTKLLDVNEYDNSSSNTRMSSLNTNTKASITPKVSSSLTSALNSVKNIQTSITSSVGNVATSSKTSSKTVKSTTTASTPVVTKVDYSGEIKKLSDAIVNFSNVDAYLKKALDYLNEGLIINGSNPFSKTLNTVKSSTITENGILKNEILPEMR